MTNKIIMAKELLVFTSVVILGQLAGVYGDDAQNHLKRDSIYEKDVSEYNRSLSGNVVLCGQNTCGAGAFCIFSGVFPICACLPGYSGNPSSPCDKIICRDNSDCGSGYACVKKYCVKLCEGASGINENCAVHNEMPKCTCPAGYTGDPMSACTALM